jgi:hypothetical protein
VFDFQMGRGRAGPAEFLKGFVGKLQCDGYSAYDQLGEGIVYVGCMAHARRGFVEAAKLAAWGNAPRNGHPHITFHNPRAEGPAYYNNPFAGFAPRRHRIRPSIADSVIVRLCCFARIHSPMGTPLSPAGDGVAADISQPGGAELSDQLAQAPRLRASGKFGSGCATLRDLRLTRAALVLLALLDFQRPVEQFRQLRQTRRFVGNQSHTGRSCGFSHFPVRSFLCLPLNRKHGYVRRRRIFFQLSDCATDLLRLRPKFGQENQRFFFRRN